MCGELDKNVYFSLALSCDLFQFLTAILTEHDLQTHSDKIKASSKLSQPRSQEAQVCGLSGRGNGTGFFSCCSEGGEKFTNDCNAPSHVFQDKHCFQVFRIVVVEGRLDWRNSVVLKRF